uniref:VWFA domain-containing protein n=1 Tax=Varanus komodoensis TaxID=61221 RepID=A0A8D2L410_VARKO
GGIASRSTEVPFSSLSFYSDKTDCPIRVYFVIDTSESVALQTIPIESLVKLAKNFVHEFIRMLENEFYQGQVSMTWQYGGLHFSDVVKIYSTFTNDKNAYLKKLDDIQYIGRGTFTDCALSNMTAQILSNTAPGVNYAVVITDGHVTGSPCGGMKLQAERARDAGIKLFAVAPSRNIYEQGLREIASSPLELYRNNYTTTQKDGIDVDTSTAKRIIQKTKLMAPPPPKLSSDKDSGEETITFPHPIPVCIAPATSRMMSTAELPIGAYLYTFSFYKHVQKAIL